MSLVELKKPDFCVGYADCMFRGRFRVEDFQGERGALALELLAKGDSVVVGDAVSLRRDDGVLLVEVASAWASAAAISDEIAAAELRDAQRTFDDLRGSDPSFAGVIGNREVVYELVVDHGTGTVLVATLRGEQVTRGADRGGP